MKARFIGDPRHDGEGPEVVTLLGLSFVKGEWTPVPGKAAAVLAKHTHFEIDADRDGEADPSVDELRAQLDAKGIRYHHKAGVAKLKALLDGDG